MTLGIVGKKCGMTRVFTEGGDSIPVTVIAVEPNQITQIKTPEKEGYHAIQITTGKRKASRVNKAAAGHFAKAKLEAGDGLWEFRVDASAVTLPSKAKAAPEGEEAEGGKATEEPTETGLTVGSHYGVELFTEGQLVDVTATSKGKGFAGVIKRHNFAGQDRTHGNSLSHRAHGSTGQNQSPGRVFKGKKMAGQMGNKRVTVQTQEVVKIDNERSLLLIKGGVPGAPNTHVIIKPAVKQKNKKA